MNTIKATQYLKDNYPEIESTVFYTDLRAFGKGFEELLMRSRSNGVRYVRGLPGEVRHGAGVVGLPGGLLEHLGVGGRDVEPSGGQPGRVLPGEGAEEDQRGQIGAGQGMGAGRLRCAA